ncbi:MAG TPA: hypothetical protein V6D27_17860 [Vampirovibrionales bacterium]
MDKRYPPPRISMGCQEIEPNGGDREVKQTINCCLTVQQNGVPVYDCTVASRDLG